MDNALIVCARSVGSSQELGSKALTPVKFELSLTTPAVVTGDGILVHRNNVQGQAADLPTRDQFVQRLRGAGINHFLFGFLLHASNRSSGKNYTLDTQ